MIAVWGSPWARMGATTAALSSAAAVAARYSVAVTPTVRALITEPDASTTAPTSPKIISEKYSAAPNFCASAAKGGPGGPGAAKGGPGGPGAAKGGPGGAPAQPPVVFSRNGKDYTVTATNVRAGTEIKVTTERPTVNLTANELDKGSWVILELPGFNTAASGTAQASLDALRAATETSYFKGNGSLWVKLVSPGDPGNGAPGGGTSVLVNR